ncbi:MAG: orotidine-5'-phosphate decarboxylase [Aquificota bacterium]|nr:orotidine-5'-phosphate decarboxylase [Aquificota bacterium]
MALLCVALDVDRDRAQKLIELLHPYPVVFKVGPKLFLEAGSSIIRLVKESGRELFLDLKLHDIPNTVKLAVHARLKASVLTYLTLHTLGGRRMLEWACLSSNKLKLLGVTLLTSHGEEYLSFLRSSFPTLRDMVLYLSDVAKESGLHGVVCSGKEVAQVKERTGLFTVVPGIRISQSRGDQVRILTPEEAVRRGADMIVMGRDIYGNRDPSGVVEKVLERIGG